VFRDWDNFYLMIGGASAGLIGLLFVVVTLTSEIERSRALRGVNLYMTPPALAFAVVLTISAATAAPGISAGVVAGVAGAAALLGVAAAVRSCIGIRGFKVDNEPPHWSDLWFYGVAPGVVYIGLGTAAVGLCSHSDWAVQSVAAVLLILLLLGIRNAWDLVTWITPHGKSDDG
jgi:hypothetical protein